MKRSISLLLVITLLCGLLGTAAYAVPGQSAQSDENTEYLIFDGAPLMDISYGKDAGDQIAFAAREMRDTLKAVSGASVHIGVEDYESDQVSAFLLEDAVSVSENGAYPVFVSLANPGAQAVSVALEQTAAARSLWRWHRRLRWRPGSGKPSEAFCMYLPGPPTASMRSR